MIHRSIHWRTWSWLGALALVLATGCGEPHAPKVGDNQLVNGSFESKLSGWWAVTDSEGGTAQVLSTSADVGALGLALFKGTGGWGSMVGQETPPHTAKQTYHLRARLRGAKGGERVSISFHGQGFEVETGSQWQTVERLVFLPEASDNTTALLSVTTDNATVHVDDVSFAPAEVERGEADKASGNLVSNGSFESGLGMWNFWSGSDGQADTSAEARGSGYAGLVLRMGTGGGGSSVKQMLPEPVRSGEVYRLEVRVRGALGGEAVGMCLQVNEEPWDGPCLPVPVTTEWGHVTGEVTIEEPFQDQPMGVMVSLFSEGSVQVDDVIVVRVQP
ncbi:carbohydrate binding domain-containing protein [Stigmatella aurantiaca]|uniref:Carbohydrate binding domain protein n=1 Tax=Stigmatella aurantiaca (strain DW4/3-1) TaxID=378806 RepID=Q08XD0_STIAD|nr:carbohydrate binding domain-containing protein [Stigmatella aurantiaca]ADO72314.1 Carbohydrate binding domain protein [Stigmatella aurantiaca DW4/3-1]EAU65141.1 carbohydrate binding domain protein [Stigmatella aurantiaca DW4/3-1]